MNFLAHLHLAAHTGSSLTGNLLGDFVKGTLPTGLAAHFDEGIWLHRKIDAFTDSHPEHKAAVACFEAPWRRFGAIVVDMIYDHWLSLHWGLFSTEPLPRFLQRSYEQLLADHPRLPDGLPLPLKRMAEQNWIASYRHREGLGQALNGIGRRLRRPVQLGEALLTLDESQWQTCEAGFLRFYPALMDFSQQQLAQYRTAQGAQ
ncbi:ACP phosphodiesterase [Aeromonas veronii]|uniref:acyl carrier protein phosphodiesterase n=1 Tax=Aeromonas TaxID=642 RepID=UPI00214D6CFB|nr:ACP phosphodiesterase [Aeromonas veronii]MCR3967658.1 ACP phosphodiesterase [Aeromonas veronii]MCR3980139.1 ACP phosphodiesterase [Aeromonas veronii]